MFAITNASEFFAKVKDDLSALEEKIDDSGRAMNCILSAYHLHEWVWAHALKHKAPLKLDGVMIKDKASFVAWLEGSCPHFITLQELANGTKHCVPVNSTHKVEGYGMGPYGIGPWGKSYLLIDSGAHLSNSQRWLVATDMLRAIIDFWDRMFQQYNL